MKTRVIDATLTSLPALYRRTLECGHVLLVTKIDGDNMTGTVVHSPAGTPRLGEHNAHWKVASFQRLPVGASINIEQDL